MITNFNEKGEKKNNVLLRECDVMKLSEFCEYIVVSVS